MKVSAKRGKRIVQRRCKGSCIHLAVPLTVPGAKGVQRKYKGGAKQVQRGWEGQLQDNY